MAIYSRLHLHRLAIEESVRVQEVPSTQIDSQSRLNNYDLVRQLDIYKERRLPVRSQVLHYFDNHLYAGVWPGEVLVFTNELEFKERFQVTDQEISIITTFQNKLIILQADGLLTTIHNKHGHSTQIEGFARGVFHSFLPLVLAQTQTGLALYDFQEDKVLSNNPLLTSRPIAVHPAGATLLLSSRAGTSLLDLRTEQEEVSVPHRGTLLNGRFLSSGNELVMSLSNKRLTTLDMRKLEALSVTKTRSRPTVLHEFHNSLVYSGVDLYTRCVCPFTNQSLYAIPNESLAITNSADTLFLSSAQVSLISIKPKDSKDYTSDPTNSITSI
ncbi:hypothetical protein NEHOM01_1456 [Nematocida homosporus]|uniref:uncharacterized protein n=1 Tax=Nematocida homosporus TaxID=1912981 RepID=UPI00221E97AD|nr:uncharacterized protein NEHOM01_1456 [Nematocida homosporus]KAI5186423.1 hypothetical protein NEHOM01_1456 [Nematocida homosporus]